MINIIIFKYDEKMVALIEFIFINLKIKILVYDKLEANKLMQNCIFINTYLDPIINFENEIINIINDSEINFCYLSNNKEIYFVRKIKLIDNCIDIKQENIYNPLFFKDSNKIDHIIPPEDTNSEYVNLLKLKNISYDSMINFNIAYKSYEKFLKYEVENNYCYNIILFINSIHDLFINIPNYKFYRITIFHNLKNEYDVQLLAGLCKKNNILASIYVGSNLIFFFNINNKRLLWFEKVILLTDIKMLNNELFDKLNKYHKVKETIIFENLISISATDFINIKLFNFNRTYDFNKYQIFNLVKNYLINNSENYYINHKITNSCKLKFKKLDRFTENQLMTIRNYNLLITNINQEIKENYDSKIAFSLLLKKISLGILCKPESEILNEITLIISTINNFEFLTNLLILFSNIKNKNIMNKLYIKIIKLSVESKLSKTTFDCLQKILSVVMDEESLVCVLDFLIHINSNPDAQILDKTNLKKIVHTLFFNLSRYIENTSIIDKFNILVAELFDTSDVLNIEKVLELNFTDTNNIGLLHFLIFISTNINAYYDTYDKFFERRAEIKRNIEYLLSKDIPTCKLEDVIVIPICNFYLSYQGVPSNDIFSLKSKLVRKICPELNYTIDLKFKNKKKNICFHANYLNRMHSVFKDRHQIIKGLAETFNVYYTTFDDLTPEVKYLFGKAKHIKLESKLQEIKKTLEDLKLDVLVYCEIGMDPKAYFMAHMRLAKKQFNTWGHSDSSGIDTIDYFISSKLYELPYEESQKHYSEKLILQKSLCTYYLNPLTRYNIATFKDRYEFGFTDEVVIFFCAQSLFKFNPIYDNYIIDILQANKNFVLLILNSDSKSKVIKRFNNKFVTSQIHVFPMLQHNRYLNLINISDVILDPYPFGGCNSSFESFALNKVIVTQESNMINGRFTSGFYKKMNMSHLITHNKEEYIKLAIKLGNNTKYRKIIEEKIKDKHSVLFNDQESIDEWSTLIDNI